MPVAPTETGQKRNHDALDVYKIPNFVQNKRVKFNTNAPFTPTYVTSQLTQTSDPSGMYESRVRGHHMLLENPMRESRAKKALDEKLSKRKAAKERKRMGKIGKQEAKEKGIWRFDPSQARFDLFLPLHCLWMGYMSELLGLEQPPTTDPPSPQAMPPSMGMHAKLVKADFHGSIMTVRQSKNPCLVGLSGIVIHETENAFKIVTQQNKSKLIPKENSIFAFAVPLYSTLPPSYNPEQPFPPVDPETPKTTVFQSPHIQFELHGNQFRFRAADRAGRKFKHKESIEL